MAIFRDNPGKLVPECLHCDFIGAKDDGGGGNNWSHETCKLPAKCHHHITNTTFLQARCPSCRQTHSETALKKVSHSMHLLTASSPGVFQPSLTIKDSCWLRGKVANPLISPLMLEPNGWWRRVKRMHNCNCWGWGVKQRGRYEKTQRSCG